MHRVNLSDGTITLTPLRPDDTDAHLAGEDEQLVRWLSGGPGTRAGVEAYMRHCQEQWETGGPLRAFGIRVGAEQELAGTIDLRFVAKGLAPGQVNVAYGLYPSWRGQGLATRAVLLACRYAAGEGAEQAVIKVEPENSASAAVAHRAGFTPAEGVHDESGTWMERYFRDLRAGADGAEARTEAAWEKLFNGRYVDHELVRAAYAEPRLRQLFPWVGHWELHFSRCVESPWTWDVPYIRPQSGGRFRVEGPSRSEFVGWAESVEEALAMVVERLPPGCGPAVVSNRDVPARTESGG
ncbi:GNAT family N-acetyltransferase [Streptomyces sp. NPDC050803]|uniref:GNAT family N-acetyltransferase n=1 Tax=unclassified Streptomyces TaxID=2593676 RepID=UPI003433F3C7